METICRCLYVRENLISFGKNRREEVFEMGSDVAKAVLEAL